MTIAGFSQIAVIGAGQMGSGIAQVAATHGLKVLVIDSKQEQLDRAKAGIQKSLQKLADKGVIEQDIPSKALDNLLFSTDLQSCANCDLAIEAIIESEDVKNTLLQQLDTILPASAIIASNTSSIPITKLGSFTERPNQVIGMHFMNPVPLMKLVEVIPGLATSTEVTNRITDLAKSLGKEISTSQDYPGFVVNRVLMPMINEAFYTLMEGVASKEDIDLGMKLGCNQPMGPLTLADFIGLDTCLAIMRVIHDGTGDPKHRPCPLLVKYVEAGYFGRKTKRGVYTYE